MTVFTNGRYYVYFKLACCYILVMVWTSLFKKTVIVLVIVLGVNGPCVYLANQYYFHFFFHLHIKILIQSLKLSHPIFSPAVNISVRYIQSFVLQQT